MFKKHLEAKANLQQQDPNNNDIDGNWEDINNKIFGNTTSDEFGVKTDDLENLIILMLKMIY